MMVCGPMISPIPNRAVARATHWPRTTPTLLHRRSTLPYLSTYHFPKCTHPSTVSDVLIFSASLSAAIPASPIWLVFRLH